MALQIHEPGQAASPHEHDQSADVIIGIDLGTTHSLVGAMREGEVKLLSDAHGRSLLPSVIAFTEEWSLSSVVVGYDAVSYLASHPERVLSSIKRLMGRGMVDVQALPFDLVTPDDDDGMVHVRMGDKDFSPVVLSSILLRALKERAERAWGCEILRAVITVPAYFDDGARTATRDAARLAGLEVMRLVNEPTAAALAYGLDSGSEGLYVVYDLGGGTFDVSMLYLRKGVFQVKATGGDSALGGDDLDDIVAHHIVTDEEWQKMTLPQRKHCLAIMRGVRESLSEEQLVSFSHPLREDETLTLDRETLSSLLEPFIARTLSVCSNVLADAAVGVEDIKGVILAGGATRTPLLREKIKEFFKKEPIASFNPDEVVVRGAILQAASLAGHSDTILLDVAPLSLGIETMGGLVEKIIERNSPIPVSRQQEFTTWQDGQSAMAVHVLQGEREMVEHNRSLARFNVTDIPPMVAGAARVAITFTIDADGLLTVTAQEQTTGQLQRIEVKPSYGLSEEAMTDMLRQSRDHARADMQQRLLAEMRVEGERILLALRPILAQEDSPQAEVEIIKKRILHLEKAMKDSDPDAIRNTIKDLDEASRPLAERRMDKAMRGALKGRDIRSYD